MTTSKARSVSGLASPRAWEPKRVTRSGWNWRTMRRTIFWMSLSTDCFGLTLRERRARLRVGLNPSFSGTLLVYDRGNLGRIRDAATAINWYVLPTSGKTRREPWVWIFGGTAIVMLIAIIGFVWSVFQSSREGGRVTANTPPRSAGGAGAARSYEWLARFNPPAYQPSTEGEAEKPAEFRAAMRRYSNTDYAGAIAGLRSTAGEHPDFVPARLYLGICSLFTNDRSSGIAELRKVVAAGNTPDLEQARV